MTGTWVLTRSDGATLTGPTTATVGPISGLTPWPLNIDLIVTAGTGELAGATGEINLTGATYGPGSSFDPPAAMTGTLTIPAPGAHGQGTMQGWRLAVLDDDQGQAFSNQGLCVAFVETGA